MTAFGFGVVIMAGISIGAFILQLGWAVGVEKQVWKKLAEKPTHEAGWGPTPDAKDFRLGKDKGGTVRKVQAFVWHIDPPGSPPTERGKSVRQGKPSASRGAETPGHQSTQQSDKGEDVHWEEQAREVRRSFLARTQGTAERWRNIFAGLLTVFGAVLIVGKPQGTLEQFKGPEQHVIFYALTATIALSVNAVAYTGWAAAGLPKMLVDADGPVLFYKQTGYAARSLTRLRVGLICGALVAVALSVAAVAVLSTGVRV